MKRQIKLTSESRLLPNFQYSSDAAEVSAILSKRPALIEHLCVTNNTAVAGYCQVFDAVTVPDDGATPVARFELPASSTVKAHMPIYVAEGAVVVISTTLGTKTISTNGAFFVAKISE
jgi:hypothetical protein